MDERLIPIEKTFRSNEGLFRAALDGLAGDDDDGDRDAWLHRPGEANHLAFLAVHLVGARYYIVNFLGGSAADPLEEYHGKARSIDDIAVFPPVPEVIDAWEAAGPLLGARLAEASTEFLDGESGLPFPTPGPSRLDALAFLAQHEAYHLGQMGLLRRVVGLPAAEWPRP